MYPTYKLSSWRMRTCENEEVSNYNEMFPILHGERIQLRGHKPFLYLLLCQSCALFICYIAVLSLLIIVIVLGSALVIMKSLYFYHKCLTLCVFFHRNKRRRNYSKTTRVLFFDVISHELSSKLTLAQKFGETWINLACCKKNKPRKLCKKG